ncbi:MAG: hypothetical protein AB1798_14500, partial [Spirochaetota bacterium]
TGAMGNKELFSGAIEGIQQSLLQRETKNIGEKDKVIADLQKRSSDLILAKDKNIAELKQQLNVTTEELEKKLSDTVNEKDKALAELQNKLNDYIAEKEKEISDLQNKLSETDSTKNRTIAGLQSLIDSSNKKIADNTAEIEELKTTLNQYTARNRDLSDFEKKVTELSNRYETDQNQLKLQGRETAFLDVINFINYLESGGSGNDATGITLTRKAREDLSFRNAIEKIQAIYGKRDTAADEGQILSSQLKFLGTVASVSAGRVVIEPLVSLSVFKGSQIWIKRKSGSREETTIAQGTVSNVSSGKIQADVDRLAQAAQPPTVMDLVYVEVKE